jgi:hypothetical protein
VIFPFFSVSAYSGRIRFSLEKKQAVLRVPSVVIEGKGGRIAAAVFSHALESPDKPSVPFLVPGLDDRFAHGSPFYL